MLDHAMANTSLIITYSQGERILLNTVHQWWVYFEINSPFLEAIDTLCNDFCKKIGLINGGFYPSCSFWDNKTLQPLFTSCIIVSNELGQENLVDWSSENLSQIVIIPPSSKSLIFCSCFLGFFLIQKVEWDMSNTIFLKMC